MPIAVKIHFYCRDCGTHRVVIAHAFVSAKEMLPVGWTQVGDDDVTCLQCQRRHTRVADDRAAVPASASGAV